MLKFNVCPRFLLVLAIQNVRAKVGKIEVVGREAQPCGMARVIKSGVQMEALKDIKEGDIVFFQNDKCQPIRLEDSLEMHGLIWEESVLGWVKAEDAETIAASIPMEPPQPLIMPPGRSRLVN